MTATLEGQARELLDLVRDAGYRPTISNLCVQAQKRWPDLGDKGRVKDLDELAGAALRLNSGGSANGDGIIPTGPGATSDGDWPLRTVARPPPEVPPTPTLRMNRPRGAGQSKTAVVLDALRIILPEHPKATSSELYDLVAATGIEMVARSTFKTTLCGRMRKELGIAAPTGWSRANRLAPGNVVATPPPALERPSIDHQVSADAIGVNRTTKDTAAPPPADGRRDEIRISGGGQEFTATRQGNGAWRVAITATVDEKLMSKLAAAIWERVMGEGAA